ncbi:MAG TPA: class I SAM-dependent methyltransferase [Saliniramus sp.]|nr:class I SAM-dependent methyltransferase [Saliniramus sp.]
MTTQDDAKFWDRAAPKYAASKIADMGGYERTLERTRALLDPHFTVLELGCGTGSTALRLAGGVQSYVATDISAAMIAIAHEKLAASPGLPLTFRAATAQAMAGEGNQYDAVLGLNYLHLVRDLPGTLRCIRSLLAPGGLFISKSACLADMNVLIRLAIPVMQLIGKAPHVNVFTAAGVEQEIRDAGFEILAVERHATKGKDSRPFILARKM